MACRSDVVGLGSGVGPAVPIAAALQRAQLAANRSRDLQESLLGHSEQSHPGLLMHLNACALDGAFGDGFCPYTFGEQRVVPPPDLPLTLLCQVSICKSAPMDAVLPRPSSQKPAAKCQNVRMLREPREARQP